VAFQFEAIVSPAGRWNIVPAAFFMAWTAEAVTPRLGNRTTFSKRIRALVPLEILHLALVLFRSRPRPESTEIAPLAGLRIHLRE
jgi:hypothetical protein